MSFKKDAEFYDLFSSRNYAKEADEIVAKYPDAKMVLEIGAGTGKLTAELKKRGLRVVAIEPCSEMRKSLVKTGAVVVSGKIQTFFQKPRDDGTWAYDLGIAHYDVINFIPHEDIKDVLAKIRGLCKYVSIDSWNSREAIRFFQYRRAGNVRRFRFAHRWLNTVYLWFFYKIPGKLWPVVSFHKIYLHSGSRDIHG